MDPGAGDAGVNEENLEAETHLTYSAEAIPLIEGKNGENVTSQEEPAEGETTDEVAQSPGNAEAIVVEDLQDMEPRAGDERFNEENLGAETHPTDSAAAIPLVEDENDEAATSQEELPEGETTDEVAQSPGNSEAIVVEDLQDMEPGAEDAGLNEGQNLGAETDLTDSGEASPLDAGEIEEAATSNDELGEGETTDEVAQSPENDEAIVVEDLEDMEPGAADEGVNEEENLGAETHPTDSAAAIPLVEDENDESATSQEELAEGETTDEVAQSSGNAEAMVVEDLQDMEPGAGDEGFNEENIGAETHSADSAAAIPLAEDENDEAATSQEELAEGETTDEVAQSPENAEAIVVDDLIDYEEENLGEETHLTDSAEAIPLIAGENEEAATYQEEPVEGERIDEVAQSPVTAEAIVVEDVQDMEPGAEDAGVDEWQDLGAEADLTDSGEASPLVAGEIEEAPTSNDELGEGETTDEVAQSLENDEAIVVEDVEDMEPGAGDEGVNEEENLGAETHLADSAEAIPLVAGENDEAAALHEELGHGERTDEVTQSPETLEAIVGEHLQDMEPGAGDEGVSEGEHLGAETHLTDSAEAIPPIEDNNEEAATSHEELAQGEAADGVAQSSETPEAIVVEDLEDMEPGAGHEGVNEEEDIGTETHLTDSAEAIPLIDGKNEEAATSHEEVVEEETSDEVAQSGDTAEVVVEDLKDGERGAGDEDMNHEEYGAEGTTLTDSAVVIPVDEGNDVEAQTPDEELAKEVASAEKLNRGSESGEDSNGEEPAFVVQAASTDLGSTPGVDDKTVQVLTLDEDLTKGDTGYGDVESPKSGTATLVESTNGEEFTTSDEDANQGENLGDEDLSPNLLVDAIPGATHDELAKDETVPDDSGLDIASDEATSAVEDFVVEAPTAQEELSNGGTADKVTQEESAVTCEDVLADEFVSIMVIPNHNAQTVNHKEGSELAGGDEDIQVDEFASAPECIKLSSSEKVETINHYGNEPVLDEREEPGDSTSASEDNDVDAQTSHEELAKEASTEDAAQSEEASAVPPFGSAKEKEPLTVDEDLTKEPSIARKVDLTTDFAGMIPSAEEKTLEAPTSLEVVEEKAFDVSQSLVSVEATNVIPAVEGKDEETLQKELCQETVTAGLSSATEGTEQNAAGDEGLTIECTELTHSPSPSEEPDLGGPVTEELLFSSEVAETLVVEGDGNADSVPLSTHSADLSSSWISVSPIQYADGQTASDVSHFNLSKTSESGIPEDDLSSGGDGWRIVSEQDISALGLSKSKMQDVDTGSGGTKFPFSIVLWCSQSITTLFGGPQK